VSNAACSGLLGGPGKVLKEGLGVGAGLPVLAGPGKPAPTKRKRLVQALCNSTTIAAEARIAGVFPHLWAGALLSLAAIRL